MNSILLSCIDMYSKLGYNFIDVPFIVDKEVSNLTKPIDIPNLHHNDRLVYIGSGEQSFVQMILDGKLSSGKYMCLTPCYRSEPVLDELHHLMFLKLELINIGTNSFEEILMDCQKVLQYHTKSMVYRYVHRIGIDLMCNDVEIGSYGLRSVELQNGQEVVYSYGTGLALPRFNQCGGDVL